MWKTEESIMPSCPEQFSIIYAFKIKHVKGNPTLLGMIISLITVDQTGEGRTRTRTVLASARAQEKTIAKTKLNAKRTKKIAFSSESKAIWTNPQGLGGGCPFPEGKGGILVPHTATKYEQYVIEGHLIFGLHITNTYTLSTASSQEKAPCLS